METKLLSYAVDCVLDLVLDAFGCAIGEAMVMVSTTDVKSIMIDLLDNWVV